MPKEMTKEQKVEAFGLLIATHAICASTIKKTAPAHVNILMEESAMLMLSLATDAGIYEEAKAFTLKVLKAQPEKENAKTS